MKIQEYVDLTTFSTFMVSAIARYFSTVSSVEEVKELIRSERWASQSHYILGEGSNTLFVNSIDALVVKNEIQGLSILEEDENQAVVKVGGGENWHHFVLWAVDQDLWGIENLVLIPGTVGASPVQNIGAYGVEVRNTIVRVETVDTETGELVSFTNEECLFRYRGSFFKDNPGRYFITHVIFSLNKQSNPVLEYGAVAEELAKKNIKTLHSRDIATVVTQIRDRKLPRVGDVGTAGSFFKNPIVSKEKAEELLETFPDMKQFPGDKGTKLSAAWLIENLGLKGETRGPVGTYEKHALVLVNHGGAKGSEVWNFAEYIIQSVNERFGVTLEPEVNIIGL